MKKKYKIVHCFRNEKFVNSFVDLISIKFGHGSHAFLINNDGPYEISDSENIFFFLWRDNPLLNIKRYLVHLKSAEKIILHGLFDNKLLLILFFNPKLLRKSYWVAWGGDLYIKQPKFYQLKRYVLFGVRYFVIKNMGFILTYLSGDYDYAKLRFSTSATYIECLMYLSNVSRNSSLCVTCDEASSGGDLKILIGNSADKTNNHIPIIEKLKECGCDRNYRYIFPLSYGDFDYAERVKRFAGKMLGSGFEPLNKFMSADEYDRLLAQVDIAVFAHDRQQAMGTTIALLGMGKKVFLKRGTTQWKLFESLGVKVFDFDYLDLSPIDGQDRNKNIALVSSYFSVENLVEQYENVFTS